METNRNEFRIQYLYRADKTRDNKNGTTSLLKCHVVFRDTLPATDDVKVKNVISLTEKQARHLARTVNINKDTVSIDKIIEILSSAIGSNRSSAVVSSEFHKKGDKYIAGDVEMSYEKDSWNNKIESLCLSDKVTQRVDERVAYFMLGNWESADPFEKAGAKVLEPAL